MTFYSIANIFRNCQEMNTMQSNYSCKRMMNSITFSEGVRNIAIHVEMDTIPTQDSRLTTMSKLSVCNMPNKSIFFATSQHQVRSIFSSFRAWVTHHLYISCQQPNFSFHFETIASIRLNDSQMLELKWFIYSYLITSDCNNFSLFGLVMVKTS